ncbi:MAG: hypothetical protein IT381_31040 [Deltaproteobacteria bacterium]|nr:hypothetical protein [Deltaproteobacteria bacterium]
MRLAIDLRFVAILLFVAVAFPLCLNAIPTPPLTWAEVRNVKNPLIAAYGEESEPRTGRLIPSKE